jgi:hypothetical protein
MLFTGDDGLAGIWNLQECFREGLNDLVVHALPRSRGLS